MARLQYVRSWPRFLVTSRRPSRLDYRVETLEWMVADSPAIIRAFVVDFAREEDQATNAVVDTVVVRVLETLKGVDKPFHTFTISNRAYCEALPDWKKSGSELLIFLTDKNRGEHEAKYDFRPREIATGVLAIFDLSKVENKQRFARVYTGDLRDLTEPEVLLAAGLVPMLRLAKTRKVFVLMTFVGRRVRRMSSGACRLMNG